MFRWMLGICCLTLPALGVATSQAADLFEDPVRIEADGQAIDTGKVWGHCAPCLEDMDGDGLVDLIVGDFSGKFHLYRNEGTKTEPKFTSAGNVQASGEDAKVPIYCCVGSQARFVDLNGDGHRDFISSSYDPGHCYYFQRNTDGTFAASQELKDKSGTPIRSSPAQQQVWQSFGSFFTPIDWDADGDSDLLIGCFDGHLKLRINEGSAKEPSFGTENLQVEAGGEPLKVEAHCCPTIADWDGDGLWDIIVGEDSGRVTWFQNVGGKAAPKFEAAQELVAKAEGNGYGQVIWSEEELVPSIRAQVEVADINGDGKLDLLLGDFSSRYHFRDDLTADEKAKIDTLVAASEKSSLAFAEAMKSLRASFRERFPGDAIYSDEADKAWSKEYGELRDGELAQQMKEATSQFAKKIRPYLSETASDGDEPHNLYLPHGYVWLFIRK